MATQYITVSSTPVAVIAGATGWQVSVSPAPGNQTQFQVYDQNQNAIGGLQPVNSSYQFIAPQTGDPFYAGQIVGYLSVPTGTTSFKVQDSNPVLYPAPQSGGAFPSGAITQKSGRAFLTGASATAYTMAAPIAGADDFKLVEVVDTTGHAHAITFPANSINGTLHVATYNGTVGSTLAMRAFGGVWYVNAGTTVSLS